MQWILLENSWGGAIELGILADWFEVQIASVDVQTGRIDLFGSECAKERVYVMYSGIHYDALALSAGPSFPQTVISHDLTQQTHLQNLKPRSWWRKRVRDTSTPIWHILP